MHGIFYKQYFIAQGSKIETQKLTLDFNPKIIIQFLHFSRHALEFYEKQCFT